MKFMTVLNARYRSFWTWLFIAGVIVVIVGSLSPESSPLMKTVEKLPFTDKAIHFSSYLVLGILASLARPGSRAVIVFLIGLALMGAVLEFAQAMVPGRTPDFLDEGANVLGAISGLFLGRLPIAKPAPATVKS